MKRRGLYVTRLSKAFVFKSHKAKEKRTSKSQSRASETKDTTLDEDTQAIIADVPVLSQTQEDDGAADTMTNCKRLSTQLCNNVTMSVWKADLTDFKVDAVVNAANSKLGHHGGLAKALCDAGGPDIQAESNKYILEKGQLPTGQAHVTTAGKLRCNSIIHVVGPCLQRNPTPEMIRMAKPLLKKAVVNLLKIAEQHNLCSVAIPAISSGIFNFPLPLCADVIVTTIKQYCKQKKANSPPFKLHLVNNDNKTVREMERACKKILSCHEDKDMPPTAKVHLQVKSN
ncbi:macro domain-containing protein LA_4133-like [Notolabrus celidotus]|uniref:macro domain-containing protein LA_4133-like n=1 Tax=Notolabrus celidotus TaxID=1203425 RepID=UPI00148FC692|nr:macro domain-containing protein LA_4133-like [Notolabrus celidotus]